MIEYQTSISASVGLKLALTLSGQFNGIANTNFSKQKFKDLNAKRLWTNQYWTSNSRWLDINKAASFRKSKRWCGCIFQFSQRTAQIQPQS